MTIESFNQRIKFRTIKHQFSEIDDFYRRILRKCRFTFADRLCNLLDWWCQSKHHSLILHKVQKSDQKCLDDRVIRDDTWIRRRFSHQVNHSTNFEYFLSINDTANWFAIIVWLSCKTWHYIREAIDDRSDVSSSIIRTKRDYENSMNWWRYKFDRCNDEDFFVSDSYEVDWHKYHRSENDSMSEKNEWKDN
jgi:hypothetical protein